jgi:hypothetical protein
VNNSLRFCLDASKLEQRQRRSDTESDCDSDSDPDNAVQAALSGSKNEAPGICWGIVITLTGF